MRTVHHWPIIFAASIAGNIETMWMSGTQLDATASTVAENRILPQVLEAKHKKVPQYPHHP